MLSLSLVILYACTFLACHGLVKTVSKINKVSVQKDLIWSKVIENTTYLDAQLIGDDTNGYALFTITKDKNKEKLTTYLVSFKDMTIKSTDNKITKFKITYPGIKEHEFYLNTVNLNNIKYYSNLGCNINSGIDIYELVQSPDKLSYVFPIGLGLPYHYPGMWLITKDKINLVTPNEINGYKFRLSDEANLLFWAACPLWSPDGKKIVYLSNRRKTDTMDIWILDVLTGKHRLIKMPGRHVKLIAWKDNSTILYLNSQNGSKIESLNINTNDIKVIGKTNDEFYGLMYSPRHPQILQYIDSSLQRSIKLPDGLSFYIGYLGITSNGYYVFYNDRQLIFINCKNVNDTIKVSFPKNYSLGNICIVGSSQDRILFLIDEKDPTNTKLYPSRSLWFLDLGTFLGKR